MAVDDTHIRNQTDRVVAADDAPAADDLVVLVYDELRRLAEKHLRHERPDHTLQATALVNEVYLKLAEQTRAAWKSRDHFMAVAAQAVRRILVDHARTKSRQKRGGGQAALALDTALLAETGRDLDLLALDEALTTLAATEPDKALVVELRFFGEMSETQIADVMGITERTVRRYWQYARAWLYRALGTEEDGV